MTTTFDMGTLPDTALELLRAQRLDEMPRRFRLFRLMDKAARCEQRHRRMPKAFWYGRPTFTVPEMDAEEFAGTFAALSTMAETWRIFAERAGTELEDVEPSRSETLEAMRQMSEFLAQLAAALQGGPRYEVSQPLAAFRETRGLNVNPNLSERDNTGEYK